jgi:hypothetical protein
MAKPTLDELLARRATLLEELDALEQEVTERLPEDAPKCHWCKTPFSKGWHASCCGGC